MITRNAPFVRTFAAALVFAIIALSAAWLGGVFTASAQDATGFTANEAVVVNADGLNLRDDASSSANVIEVLPEGTYATVLDGPIADSEYSWYQIEVDGVSGYVAGDFLADAASSGTLSVGATVYVNTDALNLRDDATTSGNVVAELPTNTVATVLDGPVDADGYAWYQLDVDGTTGWAARDFLALSSTEATSTASVSTSTSSGATLIVNTDSLNVRDAAGLDGSVLETLAFGDSVTDLGVTESVDGFDWAEIETASGTDGWVVSNYLTSDSADLSLTVDAVAKVNTDALNLRDSASLSGSTVATLVSGDSVTILSASEAADGYLWYEVDTAYGTGWVVGDYLAV
jgi:uncharacterized protein YgiM (DUF1202 family)